MPSGEQSTNATDEVTPPTDDELSEMLERQREINAAMAEVTEFISLSGLRWSELRALRVHSMREIPYRGIKITRAHSDGYAEKGTKTRNTRIVPLTGRAWEIAQKHAGDRGPADYLFVSKSGMQLRGGLFRRFVKWSETSKGHTIHDLRHYAASSWLRAGLPVHQVARWLGHKNASTLLRIYAHVLGEQQEIAALKHLDGLGSVRAESASALDDANLRSALDISAAAKISPHQRKSGGDGGI